MEQEALRRSGSTKKSLLERMQGREQLPSRAPLTSGACMARRTRVRGSASGQRGTGDLAIALSRLAGTASMARASVTSSSAVQKDEDVGNRS